MKKKILTLPLYPFLFAIFVSIHVYSIDKDFYSFNQALQLSVFLLIVSLSGFFFLRWLLDNANVAAVAVFLLFLIIIYPKLAVIAFILFVFAIYLALLKKNRNVFGFLNFALNMQMIVFFLYTVIPLTYDYNHQVVIENSPLESSLINKQQIVDAESFPSVIHIVLDGLGGTDALNKYMGFDDTNFTSQLKKLGFEVVPANTPYNRTLFTLGSVFWGEYIKEGKYPAATKFKVTQANLKNIIAHGAVVKAFNKLGYHIYYVNSGYFLKPSPKNLLNDVTCHPSLLRNTMLDKLSFYSKLVQSYLYINPDRFNYDCVHSAFDVDFKNLQYPAYIFMHIISPHPPFVFDSQGNFVNKYEYNHFGLDDGSDWHHYNLKFQQRYRNGYVDKIKYTQNALIKLVKKIKKKIRGPKVIIVHGDHGSKLMNDQVNHEISCFDEVFTTTFAIYSDNSVLKTLYASQKPFNIINVYRTLFNGLFSTDYDILSNKSYFIPRTEKLELIKIKNPHNETNCIKWVNR